MEWPELTLNNHFRFGYGSQFLTEPTPKDRWTVAYGKSNRFGTFYNECVKAAQLIQSKTSKPIWLLFSGGIDSEVMVRSFLAAKIDFRVAILQFTDNLNLHDISYAVITCDQLGLEYKLHTLDIKKFWGSDEFWKMADLSTSVSPQFISTMWLVNEIDGYSVIGSGEPYFVRSTVELTGWQDFTEFTGDTAKEGWDLWEKEKVACLFRYFINARKEGCPAFFQYTPEIIDSFTFDPAMQSFFRNAATNIKSTFQAKHSLYEQYFPLLKRPKYTGFEKLAQEDAYYRKLLMERFAGRNAVYRTHISS